MATRPTRKRAAKKSLAKRGAGAATVDDYLAALPADMRAALAKLRRTIRAAAPKATERISYGIPVFEQQGGLVGLGAGRSHCAFYVMSVDVMAAHAAELEGYAVGKGSIRFPADQPLPAALVKKLVRARLAENRRLRG